MLEVGLRVVRGKDWKWKDQDGGEGHAGTVVEIGRASTANPIPSNANPTDKTPDKTVIVQWDRGSRSNYRIGYEDCYDLLVFDNAAAGVKHRDIACDGCKTQGIFGMAWKCTQCTDYDLCTWCYMADVHDLSHPFKRFQVPNSVGVEVGPRKNYTKIPLKGTFVGAKVVRGHDWEWGTQDSGGTSKIGKVIDIRGWDNESSRSVATVTWSNGRTNVYRLGYKGCVDLCYDEPATAGTYYKEHLPLLGIPEMILDFQTNDTNNINIFNSNFPTTSHLSFNVGDEVKVLMDVQTLKSMQAGHGGWNNKMAEYIGKIGTVHRLTDKGNVRVQYDAERWTFHPGALTKVVKKEKFSVGDIVKVKSDINTVKNCQKGHGEWIDDMKTALGKMGKVIKIYPDGDMRILIAGRTWTFNPINVNLIPQGSTAANIYLDSNKAHFESTDSEVEKLLKEAARGKAGIPTVKEFLRKYPDRVDARGGPGGGKKTCLQVAAHQGQKEPCILLLDAGASLFAVDEDGDSPLHYAAFGNQPEIIELLLSRGAPIDAVNNAKCTALHVAVNKQHRECVKVLLRHGCNVNFQDSYGDTTLHDAIGKDDLSIIDALCSCNSIDFTLQNKRGFNVLHHAALKGNAFATQKLIQQAKHLLDLKKDDGFAALHLAALNGHKEVAAVLISSSFGRAKIDLQNNRQQTPLHLAVSQGHWSVVELLVNNNANISCVDEDGDTALHIAISKKRRQSNLAVTAENHRDSPGLYAIYQDLVAKKAKTELTLVCFLVRNDLQNSILENSRNSKGKTPLDLLQADPDFSPYVSIVKSYKNNTDTLLDRLDLPNPSTSCGQVQNNESEVIPRSEVVVPESLLISYENNCNTCERPSRHSQNSSNENRDALSQNFTCPNCSQCGSNYNRQQFQRDSRMSREELEIEVEREKAKNGISEKTKEYKSDKEKDKDLERLRYLETRIADLEEANMCSICMESRRNVAFLCGHGACEDCARPLKTCHMCRQTITQRINLY